MAAQGSIPAGAGATYRSQWRNPGQKEHPRGRGGDSRSSGGRPSNGGASPRARGRHPAASRWRRERRSIPAGAGATAGDGAHMDPIGEHPRGRGGDFERLAFLERHGGASPRARGRPGRGEGRRAGRGSIPAGAGATSPAWGWDGDAPEHPRGRGGDGRLLARVAATCGASPRARGRRRRRQADVDGRRSIPAGAGATAASMPLPTLSREHPRGRGGDRLQRLVIDVARGASPRARGRHDGELVTPGLERSIPAGAGATSMLPRWGACAAEHPRGRGGDGLPRVLWMPASGASPRARGRRHQAGQQGRRPGSIPAGAGATLAELRI